MEITHNNLPEAVGQICQRLESIEALLVKQHNEPQKDIQDFLNLKQVSALTGYACPTLYALVNNDKIPYFKKGQRLFFERDAIINWIREGKRKTKTEIEAEGEAHLKTLKTKR